MKLTNIRPLGRFEDTETGQKVNVKKGDVKNGIGQIYYYLFRQKRVVIPECNLRNHWRKLK